MAPAPLPARGRPDGRALAGRYGRLERLDVARHGPSLWQAVEGADAVWTWLPYGPFAGEPAFRAWLEARAALADPFYYAIVDPEGRALGCATLMRQDLENGVIEVGHIFFAPALQRTPLATEAIYRLAAHVFDDLGHRRFEWKCNDANRPSKNAALRFGFTYEGTFRQHMIVRGRNRDTAWFSLLDREWPRARAAFERWLDPANFDGEGRQRAALSALMGVGGS